MQLLLKNVTLRLETFLLEVSLDANGPVTVIFGPSGSGKTSLLDLVAGLKRAQSGSIRYGNNLLMDVEQNAFVPARHRSIGYVPQDLALFPHLSVQQNLQYGQRSTNVGPFSLQHVTELLEIESLLPRRTRELSGGEKQRVALARALLTSPRLLLLDEPLASLDSALKLKILPYLVRIRNEFKIPMLYVTHDRFETLSLADELAIMQGGKIVQQGPVQQVFSRPANVAVASILTIETIQPGRILGKTGELVTVGVGETRLSALEPGLPEVVTTVHVCIRAEDVILVTGPDAPSSARNHLAATVRTVAREGPFMRVDLDCGFPLVSLVTRQAAEELALQPGKAVLALVKAPHVHLIPR